MSSNLPRVSFLRTDEKAVVPTKADEFAAGYDLTVIKLDKKLTSKTFMFDTGIQVAPPPGYYTEILPRSSIVKTGYMLANSVGVIDSNYRGNLKIVLTKVDPDCPDLQPPFKVCQLVLRKYENYTVMEVEKLDETERGDGGFGSSDRKLEHPYLFVNKNPNTVVVGTKDLV